MTTHALILMSLAVVTVTALMISFIIKVMKMK
jgi:hypothetical protein